MRSEIHRETIKNKKYCFITHISVCFLLSVFVFPIQVYATGEIAAWGYNSDGECNVPEPNTGFIAISAGESHSLGLKQDGSIVAWGLNNYGQCNVPEPNKFFIAIAGGGFHSLGLKGCQYNLAGDLNGDCKVDMLDFAIMANSWLVDCDADPNNPACVHK